MPFFSAALPKRRLTPRSFRPALFLFAILWLLNGAGQALIPIPSGTLLAEHTEESERGRAYAAHFAPTHAFWPTRYAANSLGGLLFGVGFALMGYCPGTGAAALGQGNLDASAAVLGLMGGSYLFAELSGKLDKTVMKWGDRGQMMRPELARMSLSAFLMVWIPMLLIALFAVDQLYVR